ncbi:MAG: biotin carboxyl carrier protein [Candidatus Angelobacter sp.]|jgi:acetyl-CoA carboxylase biotin carboxyl carrier protein|nr:biotin carboxyl carrier protein [Candidatus Angelobacter sp.]
MNQKELKELIEFLIEKDIAEFELERGDVKLRVKRAGSTPEVHYVQSAVSAVPMMAAPVMASAGSAAPNPPAGGEAALAKVEAASEEELFLVKSPIVGTYYEAPSPGSPAFVKVGDAVETGQILCIIEAMKLMNEIESDVSGTVAKILVKNGQPVEYGQPLFAISSRK